MYMYVHAHRHANTHTHKQTNIQVKVGRPVLHEESLEGCLFVSSSGDMSFDVGAMKHDKQCAVNNLGNGTVAPASWSGSN